MHAFTKVLFVKHPKTATCESFAQDRDFAGDRGLVMKRRGAKVVGRSGRMAGIPELRTRCHKRLYNFIFSLQNQYCGCNGRFRHWCQIPIGAT
jgi:hypothetical protein